LTHLLEALHNVSAVEHVTQLAERAATAFPFCDVYHVALLLNTLSKIGANDQVATLLARDPVSHISLNVDHNPPAAVAVLLRRLREHGAVEHCARLAERAAAHMPLDNSAAVYNLLEELWSIKAADQISVLISRDPAAQVVISHPRAAEFLVDTLRSIGATEQAEKLTKRISAETSPPAEERLLVPRRPTRLTLAKFLSDLEEEQPIAELARIARHVTTATNMAAAAELVKFLKTLRRVEQVIALSTHVRLDDAEGLRFMFRLLPKLGASEQVLSLVDRITADASVDSWTSATSLSEILEEFGFAGQARALLDRAVKCAPVESEGVLAWFLTSLHLNGDVEEAAVVVARYPDPQAPLDDPSGVAHLLSVLHKFGYLTQAEGLAGRAGRQISLDDPLNLITLLDKLDELGFADAVATLTERIAGEVQISDTTIAEVLESMRRTGAADQVALLSERLPAAGLFQLFLLTRGRKTEFRYGSNPDLTPARPWKWDDLW
jgi:hypothetical protein